MTLGLIALRAAKEQLAAAIATIKDELQNPELAEQIKFEVFNIGSDLDDHLSELGKAMPPMIIPDPGSAQAAADAQEAQIGEGLHLVEPAAGEPSTEGNAALDPNPSAADLDAHEAEKAAAAIILEEPKEPTLQAEAAGDPADPATIIAKDILSEEGMNADGSEKAAVNQAE